MAKAEVEFDFGKVRGAVLRIGKRAQNFDNSILTALLLEAVDDNFDSEGRKGADGQWAPLSPVTLGLRPRRIGGHILLDTGLLSNFQSATKGETSVVWSPASYTKRHMKGRPNMPKRNPFAINRSVFMQQAERLIALELSD